MIKLIYVLLILSKVYSLSSRKRRMIGGINNNKTIENIFFMQVSIEFYANPDRFSFKRNICGSVAINAHWLLSHAKCYVPISPISRAYAVKSVLLTNLRKWLIDRIVVHPYYSERSTEQIALLHLQEPLDKQADLSFTRLPPNRPMIKDLTDWYKHKTDCFIVSWGQISQNVVTYNACLDLPVGEDSGVFRTSEEPVLLYQQLLPRHLWVKRPMRFQHYFNMFSAKDMVSRYYPGGRGSCVGDQGSGLICQGKMEGIIKQSSKPCAGARDSYTLFIRVDQFISYIHDVINKASCLLSIYNAGMIVFSNILKLP